MARRPVMDIIRESIPAEHLGLLNDKDTADKIAQLWKLDNEIIKTIFPSIPNELKPLFRYKLEGVSAPRGAKTLIPYSKTDIAKASKYMAKKPGDKVNDIEGTEYSLATVQILVKATDSDGKIVTIALSKMAD